MFREIILDILPINLLWLGTMIMSVINNHQIIQLFYPFDVLKKKKKSLFSIDSLEVNNDLVVFAVSCFVFLSKNNKKVASVVFGKCCLALPASAKCGWQSSREKSLKGRGRKKKA